MSTISGTHRPSYVYDAGSDTWFPIGVDAYTKGDVDTALVAKAAYPSGGTNGNALVKSGTTTAWANVGGLVFITSASFIAAGSVAINGCFTSTYENYRIIVTHVGSVAINLTWQGRNAGAAVTGSNYCHKVIYSLYASTTFAETHGSGTTAYLHDTATAGGSIVMDVFQPQGSGSTGVVCHGVVPQGSTPYWMSSASCYAASQVMDGITIATASGTFTGSVRVYGYQNA